MSSLQFDDDQTVARKIFTYTIWGAVIFAAISYFLTR
jgi:hypothetical protein